MMHPHGVFSAVCFLLIINAHSSQAANSYLGIRYADPPVRWQPTQTPDDFDPIALLERDPSLNVERGGCVQFNQGSFTDTAEDCFFLNIWLPNNRNVSNITCDPKFGGCNLPVLFYIYGGGFQSGRAKFPLDLGPGASIPNLFDGSDFADQGAHNITRK